MATSEIANQSVKFSDESLGEIKSFDDAMQMLADAGVGVVDITEYGDGFAVVDKGSLINKAFIILDYKLTDGDYGTFAVVRFVTREGAKGIITDGSTGIRQQVERLAKRGVTQGILVPDGLVVSEYDYTSPETGKVTAAKTFYLSGM